MRLIDADVLKPKILEYVKALERIKYCYGYDTFGKYYNGKKSAYLNVANLIDEAPTVEERKHGHWEGGGAYYCSNCNAYAATDVFGGGLDITEQHYCYNCGAIMDGKVGDDK